MTGAEPRIDITPMAPGVLDDGDLRLKLAEFAPHVVHAVPTYHFRMIDTKTGEEAGGINLRLGWNQNLTLYAGHVGYGVHEPFRGRRYASRAVTILKPLARLHRFPELWITCNPENAASRRSCELAGANFIETVDVPQTSVYYAHGIRQKCRYRLALVD